MKRMLACVGLMVAAAALSGCYYDPGYSYVRGAGSGGDAYYGSGTTYYTSPYDSYYGPGYYNGYYGGYYGCCYAPGVSIGISSRWYGGSSYYPHHHGRDYRYRGYDRGHGRRDGWSGHRDSHRGGRPSHGRGNPRH